MPWSISAVLYANDMNRMSAFYGSVAGLRVTRSDDSHVVLESEVFQLIIHAIPAAIAATITILEPPALREDTPIKLSFLVPSLATARVAASKLGGGLQPSDHEWRSADCLVCDGHDPEGNVIQLRELLH
jgi:catechol-2,3-dioxygenase